MVYTRRQLERSTLDWNGRVGGKALRPGDHRLQLAAEDRAGNVSAPGTPFKVVVRYVSLARDRIVAKAGTRFGVRVSADTSRALAARRRTERRRGAGVDHPARARPSRGATR